MGRARGRVTKQGQPVPRMHTPWPGPLSYHAAAEGIQPLRFPKRGSLLEKGWGLSAVAPNSGLWVSAEVPRAGNGLPFPVSW